MPCVIDNVSGINTTVTNAGRASSRDATSIVAIDWNIDTPTRTRTAPVAYPGMAAASGPRKKHGTKHSAVTTEARPDRPPIRIPAMLSTYAVPGDVPARPDVSVASASTISPRRRLIGRPSASVKPAALATPMNVESESKRSVKKIATIDGSSATFTAPRISSASSADEKSGALTTCSGAFAYPNTHAAIVTVKI